MLTVSSSIGVVYAPTSLRSVNEDGGVPAGCGVREVADGPNTTLVVSAAFVNVGAGVVLSA